METARLTIHYGIVIRRPALRERDVAEAAVLEAMESAPLASTAGVLSFGPHFGEEAADWYLRRLEELGLVYVDDFFIFAPEVPDWCAFHASLGPGG